MKRYVSLLLALLMVVSTPMAHAAPFADVTGSVFDPSFTMLAEKGIVRGQGDGLGHPNDPLRRAEALKVVLSAHLELHERVQWHAVHMAPLPLFIDMRQTDWFAPYVEAAFEALIIKGYPDGTFRPGQVLTVEEAVVLLIRTFGLEGTETAAALSPYIANRADTWYTASINAAIARNLVMRGTMLQLGTPITRGQFFDMVYRLISIQEKGIERFQDIVSNTSPVTQTATAPQGPRIVAAYPGGSQITLPQPELAQIARTDVPYASEQYFAISMPSQGIEDLTITHPTDPFSSNGVLDVLKYGVGHLFGYPGGGGKIMVYGHSSGYPWDVSKYTKIFRKVNNLKAGDRIYVTYAGKLHTYEVTYEETIDAKDTSPFSDDGTSEELILYTCWPPDSITQRYLVHAVPVETVALR
ncbi:MAG: sortase [bacterium]|nr:sortase [bacterium]